MDPAKERPFKEVNVSNFNAQLRDERYPDPDQQYNYSNAEHVLDGIEPQSAETNDEPPRISQWRLNLIALSMQFNLYFAAYRDSIHVYVPRDLNQTIPSRSDLVVHPPVTDAAVHVGGYIDMFFPHSINHIIVGYLGNLEIVLVACDDGDVLAWYTHLIFGELRTQDSRSAQVPSRVTPFLHENVGMSAWGLAIHQESRLIAVSSNRREVTVFLYGCSTNTTDYNPEIGDVFEHREEDKATTDLFPMMFLGSRDSVYQGREQNYKVIFVLGEFGNNIPSIDFRSDSDGVAEFVIAVDINGRLWMLNLHTGSTFTVPDIKHTPDTQESKRGWGVLSIPLKKLAATPQEALGVSNMKRFVSQSAKVCHKMGIHALNISSSIDDVRLSSKRRSTTPQRHYDQITSLSGLGETIDEDSTIMRDCGNIESKDEAEETRKIQKENHESQAFRTLVNLPRSVRDKIKSWDDLLDRKNILERLSENGLVAMESVEDLEHGPYLGYFMSMQQSQSTILRCWSHDLELHSPLKYPSAFSTICEKPLRQRLPRDLGRLDHFDRLSLVAQIPEMSLVIVGSQAGRVSLLTLTSLKDGFSKYGPLVTFRVDYILPFQPHERDPRPRCPLLGMAVSPLPSHLGDQTIALTGLRRWRLMLHYYDHTILSYELNRDSIIDLTVA